MSYDRITSIPSLVSEAKKRLLDRWQPEYFAALSGINLAVSRDEVVGVIGRNGAGKSTLLRTIAGIYYPDEGIVAVDGRVSALLQLGTGFNNLLSARDNVVLGGLTLGYSLSEIQDRMEMILDFAELGEFANVATRYYSSGMIARLSFAMVVSLEPDILLIDETLSVGDLEFQKKSQKAMQDMLKRASCQVIVSHSTETLRSICTRIVLVENGRILGDGEPDTVIREYERLVGVSGDEPTPPLAELAQLSSPLVSNQ